MQFVNPLFLIGLIAIAIPVVIHLFNFRRFRKVYFTNVRFLLELKQQTQKQSQLRHLLILITRIVAIASIVLAFARPFIPSSGTKSATARQNAVSVYVDNTFSMEAAASEGSLLDVARQKAREIALAYKPSDLFQLLTADFEGRHQRLVTRDEFLTMLEEVKVSPSTHAFDEIINRQNELLKSENNAHKFSYIISDFQKSAFSGLSKTDSTVSTYLIPLAATTSGNVYIDSCWFAQPLQQAGKTTALSLRIWNRSSQDLEKIPVKLSIDQLQKAIASADIKAGGYTIIEMPFTIYTTGSHSGELHVTDYPVTYDDRLYFAFEVFNSVKVLIINGNSESRYLNAVFATDSLIRVNQAAINNIDYGSLNSYNLIIANEIAAFPSGLSSAVQKYVQNGGTFFLIPAVNTDLVSVNGLLKLLQAPEFQKMDTTNSRVTKLSEQSYLFRDVFETRQGQAVIQQNTEMPLVKNHFPVKPTAYTRSIPLIEMLNGNSFLTLTGSGTGQIWQLAVPLNESYSNFQQQALFVPVMYNAALLSHPQHSLYSTMGDASGLLVGVALPEGDKILKIKSLTEKFEMIPQVNRLGNQVSIFTGNQIPAAGNYTLSSEDTILSSLAFNYNRGESDPACNSKSELQSIIDKSRATNISIVNNPEKPMNEFIETLYSGTQLWKYFIWLALLALAAEVLLIRFYKKPTR